MTTSYSTSKLVDGYKRAFVDSKVVADPMFSPQLLTNSGGQKVLTAIEKELKGCDDLFISVAFITMGGIAPLLGTLKDLEKKGVKGRILTTDYLMFSDPRAMDKLNSLNNLDVRVFKTGENDVGFHTKGYMFHNNGDLRIIVGSSNLTQNAITKNHEWNTRMVSTSDGQFAMDIEEEFNSLWDTSVCYSEYRDEYSAIYKNSKREREELGKLTRTLDLSYAQVLQPNSMQEQFILNIEEIIHKGGKRALLISATGTGKTYASAFALRKLFTDKLFPNKKALFLSHREQINKQALKSYKRIFGKNVPMELLSGNQNDIEKAKSGEFLFSTMNMMAREDIMEQFKPDEYSVIVLDECHRSGAASYQRIINYFKPELLLGMSASPERTDNFDVFSLFDHNIACEIRLQQALENDMLCPFHYFGITDLEIDGESDDLNKFRQLTADKRVEYIISQAEYYGYSGNRVKGLIFCSRKDEAKELSRKFNLTGKYNTTMLCGDNPQEERESAIERLVDDNAADRLDYIFTVDIFNEGVDIPEINQVIMLRPTESPIIFVQQLGRGLRKADGKEFVIVIDFIGNYQNNYMIPIALSGDRTGNKDNIRRSLMEGNNIIKGASTIYFDEISRDRIYKSIDSAKLNNKRLLRKEYQDCKFKLGRIPFLKEFDDMGELDPLRLIDTWGSYQAFLLDSDDDYQVPLTKYQLDVLEFLSRKFASGMRIHELSLLDILINSPDTVDLWESYLKDKHGIKMNDITRSSVFNVLEGKFFRGNAFKLKLVEVIDNIPTLSEEFQDALLSAKFKEAVVELIRFGIYRYNKDYSDNYPGTSFNLYKKYTYSEVCWLLNWKAEEVSLNIGGYKFDTYSKTYPVFINYEKGDDVGATTRYEDRFNDQTTLTAISKSHRTLDSEDVINARNSKSRGIIMPLFVRKNKDDKTSKEFYFLGTMEHNGIASEFIMPGTEGITAVEIGYKLNTPVENNLYEYLTEQSL
ncbi:MAG: DEAD/DEAH box helicase [Bacteroidales bacterium]|nr:DEAD/DEAH box helicase [Bacteroidales bacterium]MDY2859623.1 DEAD/DEAH box helicase [Candidatus Cryptobacteroides sp.]MDY5442550.1 DEAD/DEAH box helicase [Candidatus Cryptobacteroides sp.]